MTSPTPDPRLLSDDDLEATFMALSMSLTLIKSHETYAMGREVLADLRSHIAAMSSRCSPKCSVESDAQHKAYEPFPLDRVEQSVRFVEGAFDYGPCKCGGDHPPTTEDQVRRLIATCRALASRCSQLEADATKTVAEMHDEAMLCSDRGDFHTALLLELRATTQAVEKNVSWVTVAILLKSGKNLAETWNERRVFERQKAGAELRAARLSGTSET